MRSHLAPSPLHFPPPPFPPPPSTTCSSPCLLSAFAFFAAGLLAIAWRRDLSCRACLLALWIYGSHALSPSLSHSLGPPLMLWVASPLPGCVVECRLANAKSVQNLLAENPKAMPVNDGLCMVPVPHVEGVCEFDVPLFSSTPMLQLGGRAMSAVSSSLPKRPGATSRKCPRKRLRLHDGQ